MVSTLAFQPDDPSLNPAEADSFFCKISFEESGSKQKEAGDGTFLIIWELILQPVSQFLKSLGFVLSQILLPREIAEMKSQDTLIAGPRNVRKRALDTQSRRKKESRFEKGE